MQIFKLFPVMEGAVTLTDLTIILLQERYVLWQKLGVRVDPMAQAVVQYANL